MDNDTGHYMRRQPRWSLAGIVPVVFGMLWLLGGWDEGVVAGVLASLPGLILIGAGVSLVLWPGDRHVNYYLALCAAASVVWALLLVWVFDPVFTLLLMIGGLACCLVSGRLALQQAALPSGVPVPRDDLKLVTKVALDEGFLAFFVACSRIPRGSAVSRDLAHLEALETFGAERNWTQEPQRLHRQPPAPEQVTLERVRRGGQRFDWLSFASAYAPPDGLPGARRWLEQSANARMYARVFEHPDAPRPWLLCLHGYRMGTAMADFSLFNIRHLHVDLGFNLLMPILPLHGVRREARLSGGGFMDGALLRMFHAEVQALWDVRRCLAWLRQERGSETIGVLGYSLGGYNAALLAAIEPTLACVIAGIPLTDIPAVLWRNLPAMDRRYMEACGLSRAWVSRVMAPVSPLHWTPRIAPERRFIFAASADQIVPPEQPLALWRHWDEPAMYWYAGSHISVRHEPGAAAFVDEALRATMPSLAR